MELEEATLYVKVMKLFLKKDYLLHIKEAFSTDSNNFFGLILYYQFMNTSFPKQIKITATLIKK